MGFLDPRQTETVSIIEKRARERLGDLEIDGLKTYLILPDHLLDFMLEHFKLSDSEVMAMDQALVNPMLRHFWAAQTGRS